MARSEGRRKRSLNLADDFSMIANDYFFDLSESLVDSTRRYISMVYPFDALISSQPIPTKVADMESTAK
jgi:hypothetical protein